MSARAKQLGEILFDRAEPARRQEACKTGAYGTDAALCWRQLALSRATIYRARVLDWRQLAKLKSTYSDNLVRGDRSPPRAGSIPAFR